jgi:hypothetical protein
MAMWPVQLVNGELPQHSPRRKSDHKGPHPERGGKETERDERPNGQREQRVAPCESSALGLQAGAVRRRSHRSTSPSTTSTPTAEVPTARTGATRDDGNGSRLRNARSVAPDPPRPPPARPARARAADSGGQPEAGQHRHGERFQRDTASRQRERGANPRQKCALVRKRRPRSGWLPSPYTRKRPALMASSCRAPVRVVDGVSRLRRGGRRADHPRAAVSHRIG